MIYYGLLINEKLDDFTVDEDMFDSMKDFNIKTFNF